MSCRGLQNNINCSQTPPIKATGTPACPLHNPARPSPTPCNTASARSFAVDENLPGLDELARLAARRVHRRYTTGAVDPELLRLLCACALSAPSKSDLQQADIAILEKPEQTRHRRSHSRPAVHPHRAGVPGVPRQRAQTCRNLQDARQAVSQRPSRPVLQRRGRCRHRACDVHRRGRRGGARHLPDQRDPRSFGEGERNAEAAAAGDPGRRACASAGRRRRAISARGCRWKARASGPLRRRRSCGAHRRL